MNVLMNFLTILAWVGLVCGGLLFLAGCVSIFRYIGSIEEMQDKLRGTKVSWPRQKWFTLVTLLSAAFLIAKAMS